MRTLVWKEWRENWPLLLWSALLTLVLFGCGAGYAYYDAPQQAHVTLSSYSMAGIVVFAWGISALMCGSVIGAPEVASGTLQFLTALPISRAKVWLAKVASLFVLLVAASATAVIAFFIAYACAAHFGAMDLPIGTFIANMLRGLLNWLPIAVAVLPLFALACILSLVAGSTIGALMTSIPVAALVFGLLAIVESVLNLSPNVGINFAYGYIAVATLVALSTSYRLFVHGETLRTAKRWRILFPPILIDIAIIFAALVIGYFIIVW